MAKYSRRVHVGAHHAKERMAYGILISALGCVWLASEMGWLQTSIPLGPIIIIILGITLFLPWLKE